LSTKSIKKTNNQDVHSNIFITMNKEERQQHIIQLIEQSDRKQMFGTREFAELFGVSEMTVRRDLQELSLEGLLRRQHGGAQKMRPHRKQRDREIGFLLVSKTGKYSDPFFNAVLEGADRKIQELGYRITYINKHTEVSTAAHVRDILKEYPVDGMIIVGPPVGLEGIEYLQVNVRAALVGSINFVGTDHDAITFDGYNGIRQMVAHLVKRGYRRLGFITGNRDFRERGFIAAVAEHGLPADADLCVTVPFGLDGWTPELGHTGARLLMGLSKPPDAIVCASDRIAIGAIQWLHQHNLRVPDDIAVTGVDNILESAFTAPSLTTVHVHKQLMGELAAERVIKRIENPQEIPLLIETPTDLVIRQSCGSEGP
jgi:DNA-binding LacI/PurR family transcriptional regulator